MNNVLKLIIYTIFKIEVYCHYWFEYCLGVNHSSPPTFKNF